MSDAARQTAKGNMATALDADTLKSIVDTVLRSAYDGSAKLRAELSDVKARQAVLDASLASEAARIQGLSGMEGASRRDVWDRQHLGLLDKCVSYSMQQGEVRPDKRSHFMGPESGLSARDPATGEGPVPLHLRQTAGMSAIAIRGSAAMKNMRGDVLWLADKNLATAESAILGDMAAALKAAIEEEPAARFNAFAAATPWVATFDYPKDGGGSANVLWDHIQEKTRAWSDTCAMREDVERFRLRELERDAGRQKAPVGSMEKGKGREKGEGGGVKEKGRERSEGERKDKNRQGGSGQKGAAPGAQIQVRQVEEEQPRCYNCTELGHYFYQCPKGTICRRCGETGHKATECKGVEEEEATAAGGRAGKVKAQASFQEVTDHPEARGEKAGAGRGGGKTAETRGDRAPRREDEASGGQGGGSAARGIPQVSNPSRPEEGATKARKLEGRRGGGGGAFGTPARGGLRSSPTL